MGGTGGVEPDGRSLYDPELAAVLEASALPSTIRPDMVADLRRSHVATRLSDEVLREGRDIGLADVGIPRPDSPDPLTVLVCTPAGSTRPAPAVLWMHAGGTVSGHERTGLGLPLRWLDEHGMVLVSVDYRLAPEHPYPAALQDCRTALLWLVEQAAPLGVDPDRIVLAGLSAGGGLCASLSLMMRDERRIVPAAALLMSPMIDCRNDTVSSRQFEGIGVWDRSSNEMGWSAYLPAPSSGTASGYEAAALAIDVGSLPPTYIDVGSAEVFRDEAVAYASAIWRTGGEAELHVWDGGFHAFESLAPQAAISRAAADTRAGWLDRILARSGPRPAG